MALTKLKKSLGTDGQSMTDESFGPNGMKDVLQAMAKSSGMLLKGYQAVPATGILDRMLADAAMDVTVELGLRMGTTGTAGAATMQVRVGAVSKGSVTVNNTDADGTVKFATVKFSLARGAMVDINVSAVPTAGADLLASARIIGLERV